MKKIYFLIFLFVIEICFLPANASIEIVPLQSKPAIIEEMMQENGVTIRTFYKNGQVNAQYIYDSEQLRVRQFFDYDHEGNLSAAVVDDGIETKDVDLTAVTERRVIRFYPKRGHPNSSLPGVIEHAYVNLSTGAEVVLQRIILDYSPKEEIISQKFLSSEGVLEKCILLSYDNSGRLNALGDERGNVTRTVSMQDVSLVMSHEYNSHSLSTAESTAIDRSSEKGNNSLQEFYKTATYIVNIVKNRLSFSKYIGPILDEIAQKIVGKTFLQMSGFYEAESKTGVHGKGEINDKLRITFVNGILNCREDFKKSLNLLSESHGGENIHYVFDATQGWSWDIFNCIFTKCGFVSPQAHRVAEMWKKMIHEMGGVAGNGIIYHYAHSLGGVHTQAALCLMQPEEKALIRIYTFGCPTVIVDKEVNHISNYFSVRDGVCLLDPIGLCGAFLYDNEDVIIVGDWLGIPFIDHLLLNSTYMSIIQKLGNEFLCEHISDELYTNHVSKLNFRQEGIRNLK